MRKLWTPLKFTFILAAMSLLINGGVYGCMWLAGNVQ